jgi:hypothetical protein
LVFRILFGLIRNSSSELTTPGLNAERWLTELEAKTKTAVSLNDERDKIKVTMKELTTRTKPVMEDISFCRSNSAKVELLNNDI